MDIYPLQIGVGLEDVKTFGKYLGGTTANVAVAAARLGRHAAIITGVGDDPFGRYVRRELRDLGVDDRFVVTSTDVRHPGHLLRDLPAGRLPAVLLPRPTAPDLQVRPDDLDLDAVRATALMWLSVSGLSEEPSRAAHHAVLEARPRKPFTVLDLDYRPMFWATPRPPASRCRGCCRRSPWPWATARSVRWPIGESDPERAADALLAAGVELAVVKQGPGACWPRRAGRAGGVPPLLITPLNGLGAGDAFGGSLCHGLLSGWPLEKVLPYANAAGAIVASRLECSTAMPTQAEIETLLAGGDPNADLDAAHAVHVRAGR